MNAELIEMELVQLKGKAIILIIPVCGKSSLSMAGDLSVTTTEDHLVGFHVTGLIGGWAFIFYADDVASLEPSQSQGFSRVVRMKQRA
jgi:hypothetical protein